MSGEKHKAVVGSRWWTALVPTAIVFFFTWLSLSFFPYTQSMMEKQDFYVGTGEFLLNKLSEYPGINSLLSSWLIQFFHNPGTGFAIEATLLSVVTLLASLVCVVWFRTSGSRRESCPGPLVLFSVIPAFGLLLFFTHRIGLYIETLWFFGSLCLVGLAVRVRTNAFFFAVVGAVGLLSFSVASFPVTVLLMVLLSLLVFVEGRSGLVWRGGRVAGYSRIVVPLLLVGVVALLVKCSSALLGFIPFGKRWWYAAGAGSRLLPFLSLLVAPVLLMFVQRAKRAGWQVVLEVLACVLVCLSCFRYMVGNDDNLTSETVYRYTDYAENGEWRRLLDEIRDGTDNTNVFYIQCALLAEAKLGTMPDNLFSYPVNSPEMFCPRYENQPYAADFCRIFYRELGVYDEAFHQAFEYGMKVSPESGFCFSSLRHMTEYAVRKGDVKLAEKYLSLLEKTSCHSDFIAEQRRLLQTSHRAEDPLRGPDFVRAFHFNSEMAHLLDCDKSNRIVSDYLLCGLLLTKNLEIFKTVLIDLSENYKAAMLPKAYAEAAAMINHLKPGIFGDAVKYSADYDRQFEQFMALHNSGSDDSAFQGTFWYYYVYAQIPPLVDWQNYGHNTTS